MQTPELSPSLQSVADPESFGTVDPLWRVYNQNNAARAIAGWEPLPGSQTAFLSCKLPEVLFEGTRGPGKSDSLIMDFCADVGKGWGAAWRGILFRQTYKQLQDIEARCMRWIPTIFPGAKYNFGLHEWTFPQGEKLLLRQLVRHNDYNNYHGHEYPWIGWDELCNWADDVLYKRMMSTNRSAVVPSEYHRVRAATNPYGPGHNWVKTRFRLPGHRFCVIRDSVDEEGNIEPPRVAIFGRLEENTILLKATPDYRQKVLAAASNKAEAAAWLDGSWDITAGGMFDDVWSDVKKWAWTKAFPIPSSWQMNRSFDWGSAAPFSVGWWAESDGTDYRNADGKLMSSVRGDLYRIGEWYGWTGSPNKGLGMLATKISEGIIERELQWGIHGRVFPGPADSAIFSEENGMCIAADMEKFVTINGQRYRGVKWEPADKSAGSVELGCAKIREMLGATKRELGKPREKPGLFIFNNCGQWLRTVPPAPRDEKKIEQVSKDWQEDHIIDETRYRVRFGSRVLRSGRVAGWGGMTR